MKRSELIDEVAVNINVSKENVEIVLENILATITKKLAAGETVSLHGFGKFVARPYGERKCYNPITGEMITLKSSVQPAFIAGGKLRKIINE